MKKTTNNNLSDSWTISPLSKVIIALESGSRPKGGVKHITDGIPSLGAEHLDKNGTFNLTNIRYVPEDFAIRMTRGSIRKGDILVVKDGATTGETSLVRESFPYKRAVINEHVFLCRCNEDVMPDYIFYYLFSSNGNQQILKDFRGAAQGGISQRFADLVMVPLAPYDVQKLIVSEIEKQFSRLDEAVAALKRVRASLKRYKAAVLKAAVEGKLTEEWRKKHKDIEPADKLLKRILAERKKKWEESNPGKKYNEPAVDNLEGMKTIPANWDISTLDMLCHKIGDVDHKMPKAQEIGIPYVSTKDFLLHGNIDFQNAKKIKNEDYNRLCRKIFPENGDILLSRYGTVGEVILVKTNIQFQASYSIAIIKPILKEVSAYLAFALRSEPLQKQIRKYIRATAQPDLGLAHIKQLLIPFPAEEEQKMIINELEKRLSVIGEIEHELDTNLKRAERLRQAILKKAFSGRLVNSESSHDKL